MAETIKRGRKTASASPAGGVTGDMKLKGRLMIALLDSIQAAWIHGRCSELIKGAIMSYQKAKKILTEIRTNHIRLAANDPKMWDLSLALEEMCDGLQEQLTQIQQNQSTIAQMLQHKK